MSDRVQHHGAVRPSLPRRARNRPRTGPRSTKPATVSAASVAAAARDDPMLPWSRWSHMNAATVATATVGSRSPMKGECPAARAVVSDGRMIASRSVNGARTSRHGRLSSLRASERTRMTQSVASTATAGPVRIAHAAALPGTAAPAANRANAENASAAPSRRQSKTTSPGVADRCRIAAARRAASSMHTPAAWALAKNTTAQTTTADARASAPFSRAVADAPTARTPTTVAIVARAARRTVFSVSNDSATSAAGPKRRFASSSPWAATTSASCTRYSASSRRRARPRVWRARPSSSRYCSTVVTRGRRPAHRRRLRPTAS
jgi:hypothetical protein